MCKPAIDINSLQLYFGELFKNCLCLKDFFDGMSIQDSLQFSFPEKLLKLLSVLGIVLGLFVEDPIDLF